MELQILSLSTGECAYVWGDYRLPPHSPVSRLESKAIQVAPKCRLVLRRLGRQRPNLRRCGRRYSSFPRTLPSSVCCDTYRAHAKQPGRGQVSVATTEIRHIGYRSDSRANVKQPGRRRALRCMQGRSGFREIAKCSVHQADAHVPSESDLQILAYQEVQVLKVCPARSDFQMRMSLSSPRIQILGCSKTRVRKDSCLVMRL